MIGYITIGALDSEASGKFYDAVFAEIGYARAFADGGWIGYGPEGSGNHDVYVCPPFDGKPASFGNGSMIAFKASSQDAVKAAYAAGLAQGGSDEGAPGFRPPEKQSWYGAYLRDPTGNKLCIYHKA
ncbi:MAG TPA: VOC family protein [Aliidongia sp.]|nr:VOC family protein [Aliidongia sp.]